MLQLAGQLHELLAAQQPVRRHVLRAHHLVEDGPGHAAVHALHRRHEIRRQHVVVLRLHGRVGLAAARREEDELGLDLRLALLQLRVRPVDGLSQIAEHRRVRDARDRPVQRVRQRPRRRRPRRRAAPGLARVRGQRAGPHRRRLGLGRRALAGPPPRRHVDAAHAQALEQAVDRRRRRPDRLRRAPLERDVGQLRGLEDGLLVRPRRRPVAHGHADVVALVAVVAVVALAVGRPLLVAEAGAQRLRGRGRRGRREVHGRAGGARGRQRRGRDGPEDRRRRAPRRREARAGLDAGDEAPELAGGRAARVRRRSAPVAGPHVGDGRRRGGDGRAQQLHLRLEPGGLGARRHGGGAARERGCGATRR